MISVESLTKRFADAEAVRGISFHVDKGEIVGLLGPNGAGKTTTMRMLTCYVPPTSGRAKVAGFDIDEQSVQVRRNVGYLPESVPLYGEMRVDEYLRFRARLKGVSRSAVAGRLDYVMGRCGLADVRTRIIDHLSKGYRQRVGLAEALVHNPPILILDEPTVGLDPNQIRQVRELIRDLGREHTIILSSHILPEVEQICERVIIISKGRIVAEDRTAALREAMGGGSRLDIEVKDDGSGAPGVLDALGAVPGVLSARPSEGDAGESTLRASIECAPGRDLREEIFRLAVARGWVLLGLTRRQASLEDIFVDLTTRESTTDDDPAADGMDEPDDEGGGGTVSPGPAAPPDDAHADDDPGPEGDR